MSIEEAAKEEKMNYPDLEMLNEYQGNNVTSRPHVVILGAGASKAACPNGDKNNRIIPLMNDFINVLNLHDIIDSDANFEEIYSDLYDKKDTRLNEIEERIYNYFDALRLPDEPTIYDYIMLSLRKKDIIATFNWDPFLIQAYQRNSCVTKDLPPILFLHGNVWEGGCPKCKTRGYKYQRCWNCGSKYIPSPLLYPIKKKDYNKSDNIRNAWKKLKEYLHDAYYVTIFGYNAPETDVEAKDLLLNAWGDKEERFMEEIEMIDVKSEDIIYYKWKGFIHTHHYDYVTSFYQSQLFRFPRRSVEGYYAEKWNGEWLERAENPQFKDLKSLYNWFREIVPNDREI